MATRLTTLLLLALLVVLGGCSDDFLDELGLSPEDREALDEFNDLAGDLAEAAAEGGDGPGGDGPGSPGDGSDGDGSDPAQDPDWSPPGFPPPPGEPSESSDYTGDPGCPAGTTCGHASYDGDDGQAARDHYEEIFGRPPDQRQSNPSKTPDGELYDATTDTWNDGDAEVTVYTDHHGTDVTVEVDPTP